MLENANMRHSIYILDSNANQTVQQIPSDGTSTETLILCKELAKQNLQQNERNLELHSLLGAGGFGSVFLGTFANRRVAAKILDRQYNNTAAVDESFRGELKVLVLNHDNIVKTLAAMSPSTDQKRAAVIIMEYVPGRTLQTLINSPEEILPPSRRVKYAQQLANALNYAHKNCIVHLDVKPANILITPDDNCKLGDFGCCQQVEMDTGRVSPTQRSVLTGTVAYRAPEVLRGEAPTCKADIYSVGITLWQMLARESPHGNEKHPHVIVFGVVAYDLRPQAVDVHGDPFEMYYTDLFTECWATCPKDRPATTDLLQLFEVWQRYL